MTGLSLHSLIDKKKKSIYGMPDFSENFQAVKLHNNLLMI